MKEIIAFIALVSLATTLIAQTSNAAHTRLEAARLIPCTGKVTDIFAMATVRVEGSSRDDFILDDYKVHNLTDDSPLPVNPIAMNPESPLAGSYPIITDAERELFRGRDLKVRFQGYLAGELIIDELYTVGLHCGHVYGGIGKWKIVLP